MLQSANAEFKSSWTLIASAPRPSMQTTLLLGLDSVPPRFFGECMIIMFLSVFAAKITVSISSTSDCNFSAFDADEPRMLPKACKFLFPASLLGWLRNQSSQVGVAIDTLALRNLLSLI